MIQPKYNPKEALERAKLLMNYDSSKTLTENYNLLEAPISTTGGKPTNYNYTTTAGGSATNVISQAPSVVQNITQTGGGAAAKQAGKTVAKQAAKKGAASLLSVKSWPQVMSVIQSPAAAGVAILAAVGLALYWAYDNADNEDALRKTIQACNAGATSAGDEKKLVQDSLLGKDQHIKIAREIYAAIEGEGTWNDMIGIGKFGGLGTNEEQIFAAFDKLSKGNAADICGVVFEYQGSDFADDLAEDLDEADLSKCIAALRTATSEYAGEGKIFPPGSLNTAWYRQRFPCIFRSIQTVIPDSVDKDEEGFTYIKVKGLRRTDNTQKVYRVRGEDGSILSDDGSQTSNARLECESPSKTRIITETKIKKAVITEQGIDDSQILFSDELLATDSEKWATGKYVVTWDVWLRKFPCLRGKFGNATPKTDVDGYTYFENKQPSNGKIFRMYSDGEIWTEEGDSTNKRWSCAQRGGKVIIESKLKNRVSEQLEIEPGGGGGPSPGPSPSVEGCPNGFQACSGTYQKCCTSNKIGEIQKCLGLTVDNKWGPRTQEKLSASFPQFATSFTDADVSTICSGSTPALKPDDVGGTVNQINALDTNF